MFKRLTLVGLVVVAMVSYVKMEVYFLSVECMGMKRAILAQVAE